MAIMTALGGLLGGLSNTKAARTGTTSSTTGSTGTSTPSFTPTQTGMQSSVATALNNEITNGPNLTPLETSGTDSINKTYQGIGDRLQESLSSRGMGSGGASGSGALQTELGRAGAIGDLQSNLEGYALQQQQNALGQALNFSFAAPGYSTSNNTSAFGTNMLPGSAAAGALSGGMTTLLSQFNAAAASGGL